MTEHSTGEIPVTPAAWVGIGLDDEVGFELHFAEPVAGRFPTVGRRAQWVQGHRTLSAELADLPSGVADLAACHRVLSALGRELLGDGFREAAVRRWPRPDGEREMLWLTRLRDGAVDHEVLVAVCTSRPTIATLRVFWTSVSDDLPTEWPAVRQLLDQWKVMVR